MSIYERFSKCLDGYICFNQVENKRSQRPDLHAFLLLDELFPHASRDMVCAADHDVIFLDVSGEQVETLTDDQILELSRCGVMHDNSNDCLFMFA